MVWVAVVEAGMAAMRAFLAGGVGWGLGFMIYNVGFRV